MNCEFKKRCVIVSGAPDADVWFISNFIKPSDYVICADSGTAAAKAAGVTPDVVVSDFDSEPNVIFESCETVRLKTEKMYTDTMHAAEIVLHRGYKDIVILNALGGRLDHTLGNLFVLVYIAKLGGRGVIVSPTEQIELLTEGRHEYNGLCGKTFSLFPFACAGVRVSYAGVKYPLDAYEVKSEDIISVSNIFSSDKAEVIIHSGTAIIVINANT